MKKWVDVYYKGELLDSIIIEADTKEEALRIVKKRLADDIKCEPEEEEAPETLCDDPLVAYRQSEIEKMREEEI